MQLSEIESLVSAQFPDAQVSVTEAGGHFTVSVVCESMKGLSPVKRQQAVYAPLAPCIADGRVHAVNIKALAPGE